MMVLPDEHTLKEAQREFIYATATSNTHWELLGLGNIEPQHFTPNPGPECEDLRLVQFSAEPHAGTTVYTFMAQKDRFHSGFIIIVTYLLNDHLYSCSENITIQEESYLLPEDVRHHLSRHLPLPSFFNHFSFKTADDSTPILSLDEAKSPPWIPIPSQLTIPRVMISDLVRTDAISHPSVSHVFYQGRPYVFKNYGVDPDPDCSSLLNQALQLTRLDSPFIIRPEFVVTAPSSDIFLGFMMPYCPAGNFEVLISRVRKSVLTWRISTILMPVWLRFCALWSAPSVTPVISDGDILYPEDLCGAHRRKVLDWSLKLMWAYQIVSGVAALHRCGGYSGDLKLQNVVLGHDGCIQLIDIDNGCGYTEEYAPPELHSAGLSKQVCTAERDIFALGLMLWALSEEVPVFNRKEGASSPMLGWVEGKGAAPDWYRRLAQSCVALNAADRPSAMDILSVMENNLTGS